jgi:hypothetical protein
MKERTQELSQKAQPTVVSARAPHPPLPHTARLLVLHGLSHVLSFITMDITLVASHSAVYQMPFINVLLIGV